MRVARANSVASMRMKLTNRIRPGTAPPQEVEVSALMTMDKYGRPFSVNSVSSNVSAAPASLHNNHDTTLAKPTPLAKDDSKSIASKRTMYSVERWYKNPHARHTIVTASSAFYCLVLTIFSLIYELNQLVTDTEDHHPMLDNLIFGLYMYGVSILFMVYSYVDLYRQFRHLPAKEKFQTMLRLEDLKEEPKIITHVQGASSLPNELQEILTTGSLILKIGCIIFAILGIAYYGCYSYACLEDDNCADYIVALYAISIVFMVMQTHFIFCNYKIRYTSSYTASRFGTMHLVATNLWTWFRFVFFEEHMMSQDLKRIFNTSSPIIPTTTFGPITYTYFDEETINSSGQLAGAHEVGHEIHASHHDCYGIECNPTLIGFMWTSIVEYSLIGATVMFIVWTNMKHLHEHKTARKTNEHRRINFNNIGSGVILGLLFLGCSISVMVAYHILTNKERTYAAAVTFSATDLAQYIVTILACLYALYVMRVLSFIDIPHAEQDEEEESQELLDIIMLTIGLIGEMIYSGGGLFGIVSTANWDSIAIVMTLELIFRLLQVSLQSVLIYIAWKLRIEEKVEIEKHPGKHTITFLLIANISMMIMNLHESENFGVSQIVVKFYGDSNWVYLVRSFAPLTIFYRFHSSVCLADIWTNTYAEKIEEPSQLSVTKTPVVQIFFAKLN